MLAGIDFGSKTAGTTAICIGDEKGKIISLESSMKGQDSDDFLIASLKAHKITAIFIDAPLSLPGIYRNIPGSDDYFYRKCDREIGAMSPMFLGGLTARAIRLKDLWESQGIKVYEVWPTKLSLLIGLTREIYKKDNKYLEKATNVIKTASGIKISRFPETWHEFDSMLAYWGGCRINLGISEIYGEKSEGLIYA